tara:strand:- start:30 stop:833 length:804 start_codon:yes stop_codon:yes gene_type:complete
MIIALKKILKSILYGVAKSISFVVENKAVYRYLYRYLSFTRRKAIAQYDVIQKKVLTKYDVPYHVFFETRTKCNGRCTFCSASLGNDKREDRIIPTELHNKIISELSELNFRGLIGYYNNNEPLLDKRLPVLIKYAKNKLTGAYIRVLTNGLLLSERIVEDLYNAGLDWLCINCYEEKAKTKIKKIYNKIREKHSDFRVEMNLRKQDEILLNRAGKVPNKAPLNYSLSSFCWNPFAQMIITPDGKVPLCCQDFYVEEEMGNVNPTVA